MIAGLAAAVAAASVFGRVPPSLKARLVLAIRANGEWVAMVGDGVNDVLSLKQAHLGISMQSGSQATRAVADIVLLDDSFAALPEAVIEGQRIIAGMHDSLNIFLTRSLYMALIILGAALVGLAIPVSPKHNTVLALLTVGIPALFLAVLGASGAGPGTDALRRILRLVAPPAVALTALGLPLYWWAIAAATWHRGADRVHDVRRVLRAGVAAAAGPTHRRIAERRRPRRARLATARPGASRSLASTRLFFVVPPVRDFFELTPLSPVQVIVTAAGRALGAPRHARLAGPRL